MAMANKGPNTNGSQFFFLYQKQPHLDKKHSVFGRVIHGLEVLDYMEKAQVNEKNRPIEDILIKGFTIHANPIADVAAQ